MPKQKKTKSKMDKCVPDNKKVKSKNEQTKGDTMQRSLRSTKKMEEIQSSVHNILKDPRCVRNHNEQKAAKSEMKNFIDDGLNGHIKSVKKKRNPTSKVNNKNITKKNLEEKKNEEEDQEQGREREDNTNELQNINSNLKSVETENNVHTKLELSKKLKRLKKNVIVLHKRLKKTEKLLEKKKYQESCTTEYQSDPNNFQMIPSSSSFAPVMNSYFSTGFIPQNLNRPLMHCNNEIALSNQFQYWTPLPETSLLNNFSSTQVNHIPSLLPSPFFNPAIQVPPPYHSVRQMLDNSNRDHLFSLPGPAIHPNNLIHNSFIQHEAINPVLSESRIIPNHYFMW